MTAMQILQDPSFGSWASKNADLVPFGTRSALDMAASWPFEGSILSALVALNGGPCDWDGEVIAGVFMLAARFAEHASPEPIQTPMSGK